MFVKKKIHYQARHTTTNNFMSGETNSSWLTGKPYELPEGSEFIIVRVPAHIEASALDKVKLEDLIEDPKQITQQLSFLSTVGDGKSFQQFTPSRSFAYVAAPSKKQLEDVGSEVTRTEKRVWVPPKGLTASCVPFCGPPTKKRSIASISVKEPASLSAVKESKKKKHRKSSDA